MRYTFVGSYDYRKDNISLQYQLQAVHSTLVHHYNDTLDFLVLKDEDMSTTVKVSELFLSGVELSVGLIIGCSVVHHAWSMRLMGVAIFWV